jgi:hypothetical protein
MLRLSILSPMRRLSMLLLALLLAQPLAAAERGMELTGFLGYRDGGHMEDLDADPAPSWGVGVGWWVRPDAWFEVFYDRQELEFDRFDLTVDYLQIGGGYEPPKEGLRPYVTVALGAGRYGADPGHVSDSTGLSGSIGGGFKLPLSKKSLFRLEARGFGMVTSSSTTVECGPGCSVDFSAEGWWQFGVRAALAFVP